MSPAEATAYGTRPPASPPQAAASAAAARFAALESRLDYLNAAEIDLVRQAYRFADQAHLGQMRKNGDPYITHPIAVAQICTCGSWMPRPCAPPCCTMCWRTAASPRRA